MADTTNYLETIDIPDGSGSKTLTIKDANAVPSTRKVNDKALSSDITLTASDVGASASDHIHGNITNAGAITATGVTIASDDALAIVDNSDSSKIAKTSITFDGSTTTQALTKKGSFETFLQSHQTITQDGVTGATVNRFGTCGTAAATAAKTVSITTGTFNLEAGARVTVKFSNANTASSPTLNVNSKGAKNIFHKGAQITTGTNKALLAGTVDFIYDGTQYHLIGNYLDTNTKVDVTLGTTTKAYLLGTSTTPTSSAQAVTSIADTDVYLDSTAGKLHATTLDATNYSGLPTANSSTAGITKLTDSVSTESSSIAATATAVKTVNTLATTNKTNILSLSDANGQKNLIVGGWYKGGDDPITFTENSDGSVTVTKSSTTETSNFLKSPLIPLKAGTSYVAYSGSDNSIVQLRDSTGNITYGSSTSNTPFTVPSDTNYMPMIRLAADFTGTVTVYPMLTTKSLFDASPTYQPYALPNTAITPELIELVDSGAKNLLNADPTSSTVSTAGFVLSETAIDLKAGTTYVFCYKATATARTNFVGYSDIPTSASNRVIDLIIEAASSIVGYNTYTFTPSTNVKVVKLYAQNFSGSVTFNDFMICTQAAWNVSHKYVPYAESNSELTKEVNILRTSMDNLFRTPVFGFRINKNESASNTAVEYLYDAVGMTPAGMDFSNSTFNYGSWGDAWFVKNNKPVALNFDGTEAFELDPTNWWKKSDGTTDSGIEDSAGNYNFMARFPLVYINRWEDENYNYVAISERPVTPNFLAQAHTGLNGTINSNIYLPMFKGWIDGSTGGTISSTGKLRSLAGKWPSCGTDATEEFNAIKNITGSATSGWQLFAHSQYCLLNDLLTLISKSIDVKACFGRGDVSTYNASDSDVRDGSKTGYANNGKYISGYEGYTSGTTTKSTCGQFFGYDDATHHVTAFFVQDPWGNRWDRSPGLHRINRAYKVKMTPPYSISSDSSYITAGIQTPSSEGWLRKISSSNTYGHLPFAVGDGAADTKNKYFWSYFYTNSNTNEKLSLVGGHCNDGGRCSSRSVILNSASSYRNWSLGGSPCFVSP